MLVNCVAYEEGRKLADIPEEDISEYLRRPDCFVWVALKDPDAGGAGRNARGIRAARARGRRRAQWTSAAEDRGVRRLALRSRPYRRAEGRRAYRRRSQHLRRPELHPLGAQSPRRASKRARRAEREPHLLKHGSGYVFYALVDTIVDALLPGHRRPGDRARRRSRGTSSSSNAPRSNIQAALCSEAEADDREARGRPAARGGRQARRRPRAPGLRRHAGLLSRRHGSPAAHPSGRSRAFAKCRPPPSR